MVRSVVVKYSISKESIPHGIESEVVYAQESELEKSSYLSFYRRQS